jgi:hypothetical protein
METSLHRGLKDLYGPGRGGRCEVTMGGYRIDAVDGGGTLVEVQSGPLGALKPKLRTLLPDHRVCVVKPIVVRRKIIRHDRVDGPRRSSRMSPKRGALVDVFDDLVGVASLLGDRNLSVELLAVEVEEVRVARRRRPGYSVVDRRLEGILETLRLDEPDDLWGLLPAGLADSGPFTTRDLARKMDVPLPFAQRVAYCLRLSGAARTVGKVGNCHLYKAGTSFCQIPK